MENVCRTCLRIIGSTYSIAYLNKTNKKTEAVSIREKLKSCVPELTLDIVVEPAICSTCTSALNLAYQFKSTCIQTEKTLYACIKRRQKLIPSCTDLLSIKELLKIARKDINSEHNYSYVERFSPTDAMGSDTDSETNYEIERSTAKLSTNVQSSLNAIVLDSDAVAESSTKTKTKATTKRVSSKEVHQNGSSSRERQKETKQKEQDPPSNVSKEPKQSDGAVKETKQKAVVASKESSYQFKQQMKELQEKEEVLIEKVSPLRKSVVEAKQQSRESQNKLKTLNTSKEVKLMEPQERQKSSASRVPLAEVKALTRSGASRLSQPELKLTTRSGASRLSLVEVKQLKEVKSNETPKKIKTASELKQIPTRELRDTQKVTNTGKETNEKTTNVANQIVATKEAKSNVDENSKERLENTPVDKESCDRPLTGLDSIKDRTVEFKKADASKEKANSSIESPKSSSPTKSKTKEVTSVSLDDNESLSLHMSDDDCPLTVVEATPTVHASPTRAAKLRAKSSPRKTGGKLSARKKSLSKGKGAKTNKIKSRRGLSNPIKKSLDKIIQKLKEHADHDCGPIVNIDSSCSKKMPKIHPISNVSTSKHKLHENATPVNTTVAGEIGSKKRKAFNIERRQIGIKRSCRENQKPVVVKFDDEGSEEEVVEEPIEVKPIKVVLTANDEDLGDRVTKLVDKDGTVTYQCTRCMKIYRYKSHFEVHERAHILTKLFSCSICNKTFSHEKHLKAHQMIHKNLGPYKCRLCSKRLSSTTALKRHLLTHTGEKAFNCTVCQKAFAQKIQLAVHMRIHTGLKPFSCSICEATFTQKSHLMGHVKIHTGEKPYKCDLCWKQFRKPYALNLHKECHQRKPFQCKSCDFLVKDVETFKRHIHKHLLGRLPLKNKTNKPKQTIINELKEDFKNVNKLKRELKRE